MRRADAGPLDRSGDYDVELTLELARGAREPSLADKQRVLASLRDRLGSMPSWPPADHDVTGVRRTLPEAARHSGVHLSRLFGAGVKATVALQRLAMIGAVTGALGFWLGWRSGEEGPSGSPGTSAMSADGAARSTRASVSPNAAELRSASATAPGAAPGAPGAAVLPGAWANTHGGGASPLCASPLSASPLSASPGTPRVLPALPPSWAATPNGGELSPAASSSALRSPAPAELLAPLAVEPAAASNAASLTKGNLTRSGSMRAAQNGYERPSGSRARAAAPSAPFLDAVRLLQRAQRAVDGGEPALAMFLLGELDTRFARELLSEERAATRVLALCESGETDRANQVALDLNLKSPSSIYAARIARSCVSLAGSPAPELAR